MPRALDHLVLATRDLPGLAARFDDLGFTVGARNRHPWGTENHIIQFRSTFLELIGLGDGYRPQSLSDEAYPFAGFLERYLERNESGLAMAVLRSTDAGADAALFAQKGLGEGRLLPFSRSARGPDGSDRTVAFTIAFAATASMPGIGFFTCEQHRPENFWNPAFQDHPNGAVDLTGFTIVAERPEEHAAFLSGFAAQPDVVRESEAITVALDGGQIVVVRPDRVDRDVRGQRSSWPDPRIATADIRLLDLAALPEQPGVEDGDRVMSHRSDAGPVLTDLRSFGLVYSGPPSGNVG